MAVNKKEKVVKEIPNASLVIFSCDAFEDTWSIYFKLKKKYWKDCKYQTYVVTETKDCPYGITLKETGNWTRRMYNALSKIDTEYVITMCDDFFIRDYVDQDRIDYAISQFDNDTAVFNFEKAYNNVIEDKKEGFGLRKNNEMYLCSCQPSVWNREKLMSLLDKELNAWEWEMQKLNTSYKHYINTSGKFIIDIGYINGVPFSIKGGKWCNECKDFLLKEKIKVDYSKRGFYDNEYLLSIIIPYYKTPELTKVLLDNLMLQVTPNVEVIVIDDGCNEKMLDSYPITVVHQKNMGVSMARNKALDIHKGQYIVFIDSDDNVVDNYIETIVNKIKTSSFDYCMMSWKGESLLNPSLNGEFIISGEPLEWNTSIWNCIYKSELIGKTRFTPNIQIGEDTDFNKRVRSGKRENILEIMYLYNNNNPDSLTKQFGHNQIKREREIEPNNYFKTQILMYQEYIAPVGGVETFLLEWLTALSKDYDVMLVYKKGDSKKINEYKRVAKCVKFNNQKFECEYYVNSSHYGYICDNVISNSGKYYSMIHADFVALRNVITYDKHKKITDHIAVSNVARDSFLKLFPNETCSVIYNLTTIPELKEPLRLISPCRFSFEKGQWRIKTMAKRMNDLGIPFIWQVFNSDGIDEQIDGLVHRKSIPNVKEYIKDCHYLVNVSDTESFGNAPYEALLMGVPVVTTNYPATFEMGVIDGYNGYILNMDLTNIDEVLWNMYNNRLKGFEFKKLDDPKQWESLFGKMEKQDTYTYEEENEYYDSLTVICTSAYDDLELGEHKNIGDRYSVSSEERMLRLRQLGLVKESRKKDE